MVRAVACTVLAVLGAAAGSDTLRAQAPLPAERVLRTSNRTLQASLDRIAEGSALWRQALEALSGAGRHALVLTPDQVVVADTSSGAARDHFDPGVLAEVAPVLHDGTQLKVVLVVVNLPLLLEIHNRKLSAPADLEADVDRILVHEIYGHAVPYLLAGDLSGRCADPKPGERASDTCAVKRENLIRAELGLGRRTDYGLDGLALARPGRR